MEITIQIPWKSQFFDRFPQRTKRQKRHASNVCRSHSSARCTSSARTQASMRALKATTSGPGFRGRFRRLEQKNRGLFNKNMGLAKPNRYRKIWISPTKSGIELSHMVV